MQVQYTLMGTEDLVFHTVEEEAKYCMETAFLQYLIELKGLSQAFKIETEHIAACWKKMTNKEKTEMKNRAVFIWVTRVARSHAYEKIEEKLLTLENLDNSESFHRQSIFKDLINEILEEAGKRLPRSIFSLDRAWRNIYNFMDEKD